MKNTVTREGNGVGTLAYHHTILRGVDFLTNVTENILHSSDQITLLDKRIHSCDMNYVRPSSVSPKF